MGNLKTFRRLQLASSVAVFLFVFVFCYKTTGFNLTEIPLSKWGVTKGVSWIWNMCLILVGVSCYFNIFHYLNVHPHLEFKKQFKIVFLIECMSICLVGVFPSGNILHGIFAYAYFFTLPFFIFMLATLNRIRITVSEWLTHTAISSVMVIIPLISFLTFTGKAIAETIHSTIFIVWNFYLLGFYEEKEG